MALPAMVVLLASRAILGPNVWVLMIVLGVDDLPGVHIEVDAVDDLLPGTVRLPVDHREPAHRQQRAACAGLRRGGGWRGLLPRTVRSASAVRSAALLQHIAQRARQQDEGPVGEAEGQSGPEHEQRGPLDVLERLVQHRAPGGRPTAAHAQELQTGLETDGDPGDQLHLDDDGTAHHDEDVPHHDPGVGEAGHPGGVHVQLLADSGDDAPHQAEEAGGGEHAVGESGSGKTQTAFSVLGILPEGGRIGGGSITVGGREVAGLPERAHRALRGGTVAYVPQEPMSNLDPAFTIGSQLVEPIRHVLGLSRKEAAARAPDLLRLVEIPDPERTMRLYPHEISGGMAQRVLIAGAMSCDPELLIADEPTTALDVLVQAEVLGLLRRLQEDRGLGVLLETHNLGVVADLCDRVAVMSEGRIVETGTAEHIVHSPGHPYTRSLLGAVLDDAPAREPWQPREARSTTV